ncbi:MAG TPA: hypothetical protein VF935_02390 [Candidatus Acidoferrum sp.]
MLHKTINTLTAALFAAVCGAQMLNARGLIAAGQSQDSAATPAQSSPAQPPAEPAAADAEHKKAKKVWTNENLGDAHGAVSQVGVAKPGETAKPATPKSSDAKLITSFRKQLATLEAQMADLDKQIAELKNFGKGEPTNANGLELHKRYTMESADGQIRNFEGKKKQLQAQIDAVFEMARKRGIEAGQLR